MAERHPLRVVLVQYRPVARLAWPAAVTVKQEARAFEIARADLERHLYQHEDLEPAPGAGG